MLDGSIARFLIFLTDNDYPNRNRNPAPFEIPEDMIAWLRGIRQGATDHKPGNLEGVTADPKPYIVPATQGADLLFERLQDDQTEWLRQMRGKPQTAVIARLWENTSKLALIRAISDNPAAPVIDEVTVTWATKLADHCTRTLMREAGRFVSENETEAAHKRVLDIIRKSGTINGTDLYKRTQTLNKRSRDEIINVLVESGQIVKTSSGEIGRKVITYTAATEH